MKTFMQYIQLNSTAKYSNRSLLNYILSIFFLGLSPILSFGQEKQQPQVSQLFLSGPKGTVIQFIFNDNNIKGLKFDPAEKIMIYKSTGKGRKRSLLEEVSFPATAAEFSTRLGAENSQALMKSLNVSSEEALFQKIRSQPIDSLGLNLFAIELQMAVGLAYIDESWKVGEVSHYEIEKVNATGEVLHSMNHTLSGKVAQYPYKFRLSEEAMNDSLARFTWSVAEAIEPKGAFPVFSKLMQKRDLEADYRQVGQGIVSPSLNGDSSHVFYRQEITPGQAYSFYSVLYDWAGNESQPSDTTFTLSVSADEIELITEFRAKVETDAIALTWNPLEKSALYTGIEISKSRIRDSGYVVLDTLNGQEISYLDKKILKGSAYYYRIRPLLLVDNPAMASEYSETSAAILYSEDHPVPEKPAGLRVTSHQEGIQISWWTPNETDIFGYYVLRGIDPKNMERIGEIVRDTVFVDKEFPSGFSGDLNYALIAMNQNQQMSDTSEIVGFGIRQRIVLTPPAGLAIYQGQESLSMRWNDVKSIDNRVTNYLLLRRKKGEEKYDLVKVESKLDMPFYSYGINETDQGEVYEYAVASQDIWGNYSALSSPIEVSLSRTMKMQPPSKVLLRNLNSGIEISWPTPYEIGEETYIIYRKTEDENVFKEIAKIKPNTTDYYTDNSTKNGELYEYSISILNKNIEGEKSNASSIRK